MLPKQMVMDIERAVRLAGSPQKVFFRFRPRGPVYTVVDLATNRDHEGDDRWQALVRQVDPQLPREAKVYGIRPSSQVFVLTEMKEVLPAVRPQSDRERHAVRLGLMRGVLA